MHTDVSPKQENMHSAHYKEENFLEYSYSPGNCEITR